MRLAVVALAATACAPRLSVGYDTRTTTSGPLANLTPIARSEAVTGQAAPPVDGRNYSLGVGFGDKAMQIGLRVQANNVSATTLGDAGPQYLSAAAALDLRYAVLRWKGLALGGVLQPGRTLLVDSTTGDRSWGSGIRYGAMTSATAFGVTVFAELYDERLVFSDGPARGNSTRSGVTLGVAFQP